MATVALLLGAVLAVLNIVRAVQAIWHDRRQRTRPSSHPLDAALRDIAQAIRERGVA